MGLVMALRHERNPAAIMDKDYRNTCDCLVEYHNLDAVVHCLNCHESFETEKLWELHIHPKTGGCRYPGRIERFWEAKFYPDFSVWHQKKEDEEKRDHNKRKV